MYLKNKIIEGEYEAGERLIERELASELNISRTPIREALFSLETEGFVKTVPRKGVIVATFSREEVLEIFTILSTLEPLAAKLAAQKLDEKTKELFLIKIIELEKMMEKNNEQQLEEVHLEFNNLLYQASHNSKLLEILTGLTDYIRIFANKGYETPGRREESMKEHLEIMKAVCEKEIERAEFLTKIHIENSKKSVF